MAKQQIIDMKGSKVKDLETEIFSGLIRPDIVQRIIEVEKYYNKHLNAPFYLSGNQTSASGNVKHNRHVWKTDRGKGLARVPKKRMSDKGDRFAWVAAVVPGTRGGRRAHPPKAIRADIRFNKKEFVIGLLSCLAQSSSNMDLAKKYSSLAGKKFSVKLPLIFDSKILSANTKDFYDSLKSIVGDDAFEISIQEKSQRPGKGKARGRRFKQNAGLLFVIGNNEEKKITGIEVVKAKDLQLVDFGVTGRISAFTEQAVKDLEARIYGKPKTKSSSGAK